MKLDGNWQAAPGRGDLSRSSDPQWEKPPPPCPKCGDEHRPKDPCH